MCAAIDAHRAHVHDARDAFSTRNSQDGMCSIDRYRLIRDLVAFGARCEMDDAGNGVGKLYSLDSAYVANDGRRTAEVGLPMVSDKGDHLVTAANRRGGEVPAEESAGTCDEKSHRC
jgi:hypothetical protein